MSILKEQKVCGFESNDKKFEAPGFVKFIPWW